jgi:hypothetical protein
MHDLDMMAALCQFVRELLNKNGVTTEMVWRIECGDHAKAHLRAYSNTRLLLMEGGSEVFVARQYFDPAESVSTWERLIEPWGLTFKVREYGRVESARNILIYPNF